MATFLNSGFFTTPLPFEKATLPHVPAIRSFLAQYGSYSLVFAGLYVAIILAIQRWMKDRPKMTLRGVLICWNAIMAVFSIMGALRTVPFLINLLSRTGFDSTVCDGSSFTDSVTAFWPIAFVISKYPELLDTYFIVLRKQHLSFLHFFHHASVVVFSTMSYQYHSGIGLFFMTMNYSVHAVMYSYYFFKASGFQVPRAIAMFITTSQIIQMIIACWLTGYVYFTKFNKGLLCGSDEHFNIYMAASLYFAYFVLFVHFFVRSYLLRPSTPRHAGKSAEDMNGKAKNGKIE